MFFFSKKEFLIDQFTDGLIDIHNHLLPGLDDGSTSMDTTVEMIELMKACNITNAYVTPHIMEDFYELNTQLIGDRFAQVQIDIENNYSQHKGFMIDHASEYMIDSQFETLLEHRDIKCLFNNYLLCELSYFQKPINLEDILFKMISYGYQPILAHPERYRYLKEEEFIELHKKGFKFQLNLLSLSGFYGSDARQKALYLLENQRYSFVGTDAHKAKHLMSLKDIQLVKKSIKFFEPVLEEHLSTFTV
ncbi:hypothetical protein BST97_06955 [Nonlabens spongiae]|uniref:protein-tyrosine-phosphatase n=1 Tax=Nonlabens spongiae TaxID=331648 RepID=A0A1W6MJR9_9FLAO|nr:CpsB/CapC family capsule biosynthesis tyrosine phosphatase [Nonlabens spongiae]ARN77756.1 hypothetical protein BST97_06955 [Nonlabens spongiae]